MTADKKKINLNFKDCLLLLLGTEYFSLGARDLSELLSILETGKILIIHLSLYKANLLIKTDTLVEAVG